MRVRRTRVLSVLISAVAAMVMLAQPAMAAPATGTLLGAEMDGAKVVPGPGDPDGTGVGKVLIDSNANTICWDVDTQNLELPLTGSLVHVGSEGEPGVVVHRLFGDTNEENPNGCETEPDTVIRDLLQKSEDLYLEVYDAGVDQSSDDGAIRGQLEYVSKTGTVAANNMTGDRVVPGPGDPDGSGSAQIMIDPDLGEICWVLDTENLEPPLTALISRGAEGEVGQAVLQLFGETSEADPDGCRPEANTALLKELLSSPGDFYLEIYDAGVDQGADNAAIRGQLQKT